MSRKRYVYLGLLIAAAVAFLADRLFLDHTQPAEAKAPARGSSRPPPRAALKPAAPKPTILDPSLGWLEKLTDLSTGGDAFSPSAAWFGSKKSAREEQAELGPQPGSPEAFEAAHHLQATAVMGQSSLAVVDQRCLKIGDVHDGYTLTRVAPGEAEFRKGPESAVLTLPMPPGPAAGRGRTAEPAPGPPPAKAPPATRPAFGWEQLRRVFIAPRRG